MNRLLPDYRDNIAYFDSVFKPEKNFDVIKRRLVVGQDEMTLYYIDGFIKDEIMQKLMQYFISLKGMGKGEDAARAFADTHIPYVEVDVIDSTEQAVVMMMSGAALMLGSSFGARAIIIDARTYPARSTEEPDSDRVVRGAHDGFVETLIFNTALVRRRIRDPQLAVEYLNVGKQSKTDVVIMYLEGKADAKYVQQLKEKLTSMTPKALTVGHQSLIECLVGKGWYNPLPKVRSTERPDVAAAQILEGSVIVMVDNSPEASILPTSIFDFLQEADDYYFPPLIGTYLRVVRHVIFWLTVVLTPLWLYFVSNPDAIPSWLEFIKPKEPGELPLAVQLFAVEFVIDGLRLASLNTPGALSNSLSVVAGLILGDFAVGAGWLCPEVIILMAFVSLSNYTQPSFELGYAFKFFRMFLLLLTALLGGWGLLVGGAVCLVLLVTNPTANGKGSYLYPLIPFDLKALLRLLFRPKKTE